MSEEKPGIVISATAAALILAGCGAGNGTAEAEAEPAPTVTITETATPEPEPTSSEDPWLASMREDHIDGLVDWYNEYADADCDASELECYDIFADGIEPMAEYADAYRNDQDRPDYVSVTAPNPSIAIETMEDWSTSCPDGNMCDQLAESAEERVIDVLTEAVRWGD